MIVGTEIYEEHIHIDEAWGLFDCDGSKDGPLQIQGVDEFGYGNDWSDIDAWIQVANVAPILKNTKERDAFLCLCDEPQAIGEIDRIINAYIGAPVRADDLAPLQVTS